MATNNDCFTCNQLKKKHKSSVICTGCQKRFCKEHYQEHSKSIEKDVDGLIEQHNILRQNLFNENNDQSSTMSKLIKQIDNWEKEMIQNIRTTASAAKTRLTEIINEEKNQIKQNFQSMADELKTNQSNSDYVETDIQQWQKQLRECKQKLDQLQISNNDFIDIDIKSIDWKNAINVHQRKDVHIKTKSSDRFAPRPVTRNERPINCSNCGKSFFENSGYNSEFCSATCSTGYYDEDLDDRSGGGDGCFHGNCTISLPSGLTKLVKDIRKGDVLTTPEGSEAIVTYVVKILCKNASASMVKFDSGLVITPWHPVRINGKWTFPHDIKDKKTIECQAVYNFALDSSHIIIINGIECVTLGHNFKGEVVEHPYYGTNKVLDDLHAIDVSNDGFIELLPNSIIRDSETGLVLGIGKYTSTSHYEHLHNLNTSMIFP